MGMIFETHAHYNDEAFQEDREEIFAQFPGKGIGRVVNIASDLQSIGECLDLAHRYPFMYCALGIHPSDCAPLTDELLEEIRGKLSDPRVVAVGEIGLDYYWDTPDRAIQKHWFEEQLEMARRAGLPVVIHSRDIGIGGVVTFKNARKLKEVAEGIPIESIVLETDSPYLAPVPFRGKRNSSLYLPYVAEAIAQLKGMSTQEVIDRTEQNALRLYRLDHKNPGSGS